MALRILYVEGCRDGTIGGSHISLMSLVGNLDRSQFCPLVVFYGDHYVAEKLRLLATDVYTFNIVKPLDVDLSLRRLSSSLSKVSPAFIPMQKMANFIWCFLRPSLQYARFLKDKSIDIVHLNNSINTNHEWMLAAKVAGVRLISHERGVSERISRSSKLLGKIADLHICISKNIRQTLLDQGFDENKAVVVYNGIDTKQFCPTKASGGVKSILGIASEDPVIGVVGNIKQWKGQETVVRAAAILKRTWPSIKCVFVGGIKVEDPYLVKLEDVIQRNGLESCVIFAGFQENPADYISIMDVVVHASIEPEPFGRVNIEAMYLAKAVVSTNIGGPTEIFVDGENGYLIEPGDPESLAEKLSLLLSNPELRQQIGRNAHRTVMEKFTIDQTVRNIEELYKQVCCQ